MKGRRKDARASQSMVYGEWLADKERIKKFFDEINRIARMRGMRRAKMVFGLMMAEATV